jgi:nucleoid DNA-binding protein
VDRALDRTGGPRGGLEVIKSKLVERISLQTPHRYRQDAEKIVNIIFAEITAAMARGDRVELRGFGVFFVKLREGRTGSLLAGAIASVATFAMPSVLRAHGSPKNIHRNSKGLINYYNS